MENQAIKKTCENCEFFAPVGIGHYGNTGECINVFSGLPCTDKDYSCKWWESSEAPKENASESKKDAKPEDNTISHPSHYCDGRKYEPVKVIQDWGLSFCEGNAVKYIARAGRKQGNSKEQDLLKAIQYIWFEIGEEQGADKGQIAENETIERLAEEVRALKDKNGLLMAQLDQFNIVAATAERRETKLEQINDALKELFDVTIYSIDNLSGLKEILREKLKNRGILSDIVKMSPIDVANELISAREEYGKFQAVENPCGIVSISRDAFSISELQQIAEHLLAYCNANEEKENAVISRN